jgi:uncharacterized phiE125 gp8 family phage protein
MLRLVERSSLSPVSLEEVSQHVRRDTTDDDEILERKLSAAVTWAENFTGLALVDQTWDYYFDAFPGSNGVYTPAIYLDDWNRYINIPKPPLLEVLGVWGRDTTEIEFSGYLVDYANHPGRIYLSSTGSWPTTDGAPNAGRIRYRAGYIDTGDSPQASGDIPEDIKAAICIYTSQLYEHRELYIPSGLSVKAWGAEDLLRHYRVENSLA